MYASLEQEKANPAAKIFNCAQRAHGNTLENVHTLIVMTVWTGVLYPKFAAGACMVYLAGRIAYTLGYTTGDPKKRMRGTFGYLGFVPLLFSSLYTSYRVVTEGRF
ncbi:hypothetical protein EMMF5_004660 [Cystobasidiomycetes sp. EMM_F5]